MPIKKTFKTQRQQSHSTLNANRFRGLQLLKWTTVMNICVKKIRQIASFYGYISHFLRLCTIVQEKYIGVLGQSPIHPWQMSTPCLSPWGELKWAGRCGFCTMVHSPRKWDIYRTHENLQSLWFLKRFNKGIILLLHLCNSEPHSLFLVLNTT